MSEERDEEVAELRRLHSEADARERDMRTLSEREHRHETLVKRLRQEAAVRDDEIGSLRERFDAAEHELEDLRAIRDALTPPELPDRPGLELAAGVPPRSRRAALHRRGDRSTAQRRAIGLDGLTAALGELQNPSPSDALAILRARVAEFAYGTLTDDVCMLAARVN